MTSKIDVHNRPKLSYRFIQSSVSIRHSFKCKRAAHILHVEMQQEYKKENRGAGLVSPISQLCPQGATLQPM